jgi:uncharacterized membrane protein YhaH (DUF805 family)
LKIFRQAFNDSRFVMFAFLVAAIFIYLPSILGYFLHTDDWFWTYWGGFTCKGVINWILPIGRPIAGLIYCALPVVHDFSHVWIFRLISILNIGAIGYLLWKWMVQFKIDPFAAFMFAILVITLPAFQVFSSYISTLPHCLGLTTSLLAAFCVERSLSETPEPRKWPLRVTAGLLIIVSLSLNQASALYYIGVLAVPLLMCDASTIVKTWSKKLFTYASVLSASMAVYYFIFRLSAEFLTFRNVGKYDGRNMVQNYGERLQWFFDNPFFESANLWSVTPTRQDFWLVLGAMLAIVLVDFAISASKNGTILKYIAVLLLFPTGYGVSLMSSDPSKEYRTYAVLGSIFIFFLFIGTYQLCMRKMHVAAREKLFTALMVLAIGTGIYANKSITEYFVLTDSIEFRFVKNEIRKYIASGQPLKQIHLTQAVGAISARRQRNEMGEPIIRHTPNVEPLIWAALEEQGVFTRPKVTTGPADQCCWTELVFNHDTIDLVQIPNPPTKDGVLKIDISTLRFQ